MREATYGGQYHPWDGGPGFHKKAAYARCWNQGSKQYFSIVSALVPAMTSFNDVLWGE